MPHGIVEPIVEGSGAPAEAATAVVLRAEGVSKGYPRRDATGVVDRLMSRFGGIADAVDEDEDEVEDEEVEQEERASGWILRGLDLELAAGTSTAIAGPPNAGKTSLVELLAGFVPPTEGRIAVAGRVVPLLDNMPKLMQDGTAWRNVVLLARLLGLSRRWARGRVESVFELAGLTGAEEKPRKLMAVSESQKLALATMLHVDGVAYLVDSTLGGRDGAFRERCLDLLATKQAAGAAIVHTARELEGLDRLCDRVLWLERGVVVARGTAAEVAAAVGDRRADRVAVGGPSLSREAKLLYDFLRVAAGDVQAGDALHAATDAAAGADEREVGWTELAVAAGYDVSEAHRIVDRLVRQASERGGPRE